MKKRYISPFVEIVDVAVTPLMTTTSPITAPEDGRGNDEFQTGEFRGDWSNIWEGM